MSDNPPFSSDEPALRDASEEEFAPGAADEALSEFDRRSFLKLMTAGLALAGGSLGGCSTPQPPEKIVPYVQSPEGLTPGIPLFFASALPLEGWGHGVIVEQHEGRPTKIEGNPEHPSSLGGTNIFMQASVLQLYDPDRNRGLSHRGVSQSWDNLIAALRARSQGKRDLSVRILTPTVTSPSLAAKIVALRQTFPSLRWHRHDGVGTAYRQAGLQRATARNDLTAVYDFTRARRIVSLDAHFLADEPGSVRYAREFAQGRRVPFKAFGPLATHRLATDPPIATERPSAERMTRLYMAESTLTHTGAMADHRLATKAGEIPALAAALARTLRAADFAALPEPQARWVRAAADDLRAAGAGGLVIAGETQPPEVHALAHALNAQLGSKAVHYVERVDFSDPQNPDDSLAALVHDLAGGAVDMLLLLDVNPVYTATSDLPVAEALTTFSKRGGLAVHLGLYDDETSGVCDWHVPLAHPLEAWGDCRGHDGTASIIQPLIQPLWKGKTALELLATVEAIARDTTLDLFADSYDLVRRHWLAHWQVSPADQEMRWRKALATGIIPETAAPAVGELAPAMAGKIDALAAAAAALPKAPPIELNFRPDPSLGDGAWANHPWLQELPRPLTRLTWDNVLLVSLNTARKLGLADSAEHKMRKPEYVANLTANGVKLQIPVWVQPGQPDDALTVYLGGGRGRGGSVQFGVGVNVNPLRTTAAPWATTATATQGNVDHTLACTQNTRVQSDRDILKQRAIGDLHPSTQVNAPNLYGMRTDTDGRTVHLSLYDETHYTGYKWGMVIDLTACIGCNACVIACQAENNIPCVGKDQVLKGREMHWMRIDAYFGGKETMSLDAPECQTQVAFQPMLCQHCENAPCEVVCPVEATSHSAEGLNEMTYNRCVGTRYCSNNCPYKVRRFNFLQYNSHSEPTLAMQKNPNVTVRSRGVMEKCTYCVQRLNMARIDAKRDWAKNDRRHKPTEMRDTPEDPWVQPEKLPRIGVMTACQQGCPTEAIIFGDLNDKNNFAAIMKSQQPWGAIGYGVLTELNTQPRTSYLERLGNPNPDFHPTASATQGERV